MLPLPTEEDVLAVLVLWACGPVTTNVDDTRQWNERVAWDAATSGIPFPLAALARERVSPLVGLEAAIVESERRLEVERARDVVVIVALKHCQSPNGTDYTELLAACQRFSTRLDEAR